MLLATVYFSSLAFFVLEHRVNPLVNGYGDALWWAFMDVTTVGSNIIAQTVTGRVLSVLLAALGMMMFPIFTVYITNLIQQSNKRRKQYYEEEELEKKASEKKELAEKIGYEPKQDEVLSYLMYPQVFLDYQKAYNQFGDVTLLDTPTFFQGIRLGETINVQIERGKTLIIRLDEIGEPDIEGNRVLFFNLNGQRREITIKDNSIISTVQTRLKAEPTNREQIGATMSGSVLDVLVKKGDNVKKGDTLMITEAMKMETAIEARFDGEVAHVYVSSGDTISSGDLLIEVTEK